MLPMIDRAGDSAQKYAYIYADLKDKIYVLSVVLAES